MNQAGGTLDCHPIGDSKMNANGKPVEEIDLAVYSENRRKIPWEVLAPYAGQWVAISADGTRILAGGPDWETAEAKLAALGIPGNLVGWDRIPALDEESWL
jgi:hypothetical protein